MSRHTVLVNLLKPVVESLGYELWGVNYQLQGKRGLLQVYIEKTSGIDIDDCAAVSHQISGLLDVEDPIQEEYLLEVSSPGMDRPLFTKEQFQQYVGYLVKVKLRRPVEGRRNFKGVLKLVADGDIALVVDNCEYNLPIEGIEKANVVPIF